MKFIIILCSVLILQVSNSLYARTIRTTNKGNSQTSETGYESCRVEIIDGVRYMTCYGVGNCFCPETITSPGPEQDAVQNSENFANNQINLNILTGNLFLSSTGLNVKWKAVSSNPNTLRQIITWANGETEPSFTY